MRSSLRDESTLDEPRCAVAALMDRDGRAGAARSAPPARRGAVARLRDYRGGGRSAIRDMVVRGAPAIGCAAAYGVALGARAIGGALRRGHAPRFGATRPDRGEPVLGARSHDARAEPPIAERLDAEAEAHAIHAEDIAACRAIGEPRRRAAARRARVLTHCNAGALATGGYGTALGVIRAAHRSRARRSASSPTRPGRCCRARGSPPGSCTGAASPSP